MTVLVGYASAHGSTREIAERIGARLAESGCRADVRPLDDGTAVDGYTAFVLGSAVHNRRWLPEAAAFLRRHCDTLVHGRVWAFSVGMPAALRGPWRRFARREEAIVLDALAPLPGLSGHCLFSGVVTREQLGRVGTLALRLLGGHTGDYRDWDAIDAWATEIAETLLAAGKAPGR
ncbi:flavodoxin domain-containing protein [Kitasatospora purpeofusca]|uniref:flavodoxin domain-containing protein n=1 Tax=Kitasatospora purpeofusca TaxID=67352 RepID=UPI0022588A0B|nr:flavodoxin domain-containing protein [Kitasatospora purpeofusca]MCX4757211.1 flavodoxin domain-containing protein [Kitasatospora purpeofusca]WSR35033.1 flavodoxin domain-containing protein [Kitasatospora purpeofusca]